jgi:hypothetical protein
MLHVHVVLLFQLRHVVHNVVEKNKRRMGRKTEKRERRARKGKYFFKYWMYGFCKTKLQNSLLDVFSDRE